MSISQILMAIWFLLYGLLAVTNFSFVAATVVLGVLAIAIAVALFLKK
jgi:hypothetical protein